MNLFILDEDPATCAKYHSDIHVNKMATEAGQIITAAIAVVTHSYDLVPGKTKMVKKWRKPFDGAWGVSHPYHPATVWVTQSKCNVAFAMRLWYNLITEWHHRFDKIHGSQPYHLVLSKWLAFDYPDCFPDCGMTSFIIAFDKIKYADCIRDTVIDSYRAYYKSAKSTFPRHGDATWTRRDKPFFME